MRVAMWAVLVVGMVAPAVAQPAGPIAQRQAMMEQNGKDAGLGGKMLKGERPYDAVKAKAIFTGMNAVAVKFGGLFPKGTETGGKTEASPAIWKEPAKFQAATVKFASDTKAAAAADLSTADAFKAQFGAVMGNCKSCHESFRIKKD